MCWKKNKTLNLEFTVKEKSSKTEGEINKKQFQINKSLGNLSSANLNTRIDKEVLLAEQKWCDTWWKFRSTGKEEEHYSGLKGCILSGPHLLLRFNLIRYPLELSAQPSVFKYFFFPNSAKLIHRYWSQSRGSRPVFYFGEVE